jgi:hypothetical protein
MVLNSADECRQRADECLRGAVQAADEALRLTYLDLARRWRMMARQAEPPDGEKSRRASVAALFESEIP